MHFQTTRIKSVKKCFLTSGVVKKCVLMHLRLLPDQPSPGDKGSLILETKGASSWRHKEPNLGFRASLILET
jgi:hypothetical protein